MIALDIHPLGWVMLALWVGTTVALIVFIWKSRAGQTHYPEIRHALRATDSDGLVMATVIESDGRVRIYSAEAMVPTRNRGTVRASELRAGDVVRFEPGEETGGDDVQP